ncbi:GMC oxidoreductase-domain-containing protein [Amylostereum chailletii]|nr:GMC oxidoreductase-domain-containing protein [Amylostereum chailletii]
MWPFSSNIERSIDSLDDTYDYIVVGGGTAGCVLARRLSDDPSATVLLIEKGDAGDSWLQRTPLTSLHHWSDGKHSDVFDSAHDDRLRRSFSFITGLGLGGSTRINGGQYTCGIPAEYNAWRRDGNEGWAYNDLKPFFNKSESWIGPVAREFHGSNGPLQVRSFEGFYYPSAERTAQAADRLGFPPISDMHSPLEPSFGYNKIQFTVGADGTRQSAFRAYLPLDLLRERASRLHVCTHAVGEKLLFSSQCNGSLRADAVHVLSVDGRSKRAIHARCEIVLACGALRTPQLLMLSGVGPEDHLKEMGIKTVLSSPGVGAYLQDHILLPTTYNCPLQDSLWSFIRRPHTILRELYRYLLHGTGWFLCTMVECELFAHSSLIDPRGKPLPHPKAREDASDPNNLPDFAVLATAIGDPRGPAADRSQGFLGLNCALLKPASHGTLRLRSLDPLAAPVCTMRYLAHAADRAALRAALRVSLALAQEMSAAGYALAPVSAPATDADDAALDAFVAAHADTMYHYASSCRMAPREPGDARSPGVVDAALRVHGVANLRIADASVFPSVPATHPQALVYAVAEKCAEMLRGRVER